jgi:hypothetical protein
MSAFPPVQDTQNPNQQHIDRARRVEIRDLFFQTCITPQCTSSASLVAAPNLAVLEHSGLQAGNSLRRKCSTGDWQRNASGITELVCHLVRGQGIEPL